MYYFSNMTYRDWVGMVKRLTMPPPLPIDFYVKFADF